MSKNWYILQTYTGYESKIERTIRMLIEKKELDSTVVVDVKVPIEETVEIKDGKKKTRSDKILPGYVMLELDLPEIGWKAPCSTIRRIQGVTGFVGTDPNVRPRPISADEAKTLLMKPVRLKAKSRLKLNSRLQSAIRLKLSTGRLRHSVVQLKKSAMKKSGFV